MVQIDPRVEQINKILSNYSSIAISEQLDVGSKFKDIDACIAGLNIMANEIAESKKREMFFRALIENSSDMKTLRRANGELIYVSPSVTTILGFSSEEYQTNKFFEFIHPDDIVEFTEKVNKVIDSGGTCFFRKQRVLHKDGSYRWCEGSMTNMLNDPNVGAILSNFRDITSRIEAEERYQKSYKEISNYKYALDESCIVVITDRKGIIKYANNNFYRVSGFSREELKSGHRILDTQFHSRKFIRNLFKSVSSGQVWKGELWNRASDGSYYWVDTTITPFLDDKGSPFQYVSISTDITERKKSEEALDKTLTRFSHAQEIAHLGSWDMSFKTGKAVWSEEACRIYGLPAKKNIQTFDSWVSFIHPEDLERVEQEVARSRMTLGESSFEHRIVRKNGEIRHIHTISKVEIDSEWKPSGIFGICHDITERKQAEIKLNELSERLTIATNSAQIGIFDWDIVSNELVWDENMYALYNVDKNVVTESPIKIAEDALHPDDLKKTEQEMELAFKGERKFHLIFRIIVGPRVEIRYLEAHAKILRDSEGKPVRIIGVSWDITKQKVAEERLKLSKGKIRNFAKHLHHMQEEERAHLAREIHDELGQELVGIKIGLSSFIKKHSDDEVMSDEIKKMMNSVDSTIQSLRKIATELRPGILDTLGLIPSIEWLAKEFERKTGFECKIEMDVANYKYDKNISICFFRICQEAFTNIAKHSEANQVIVRVFQSENELFMIISDNGKGISRERLKNPFSMGLLGMRERANNIAGLLKIKSRKGQGTVVHLQAKIN